MSVFKIRFTKSFAHVYCTVFAAPDYDKTWANCGKLCFRMYEFQQFRMSMPEIPFEEYNNDLDGVR